MDQFPDYIDLPDYLLIAEGHTGIPAHDLVRMDRVMSLASSALMAPRAGFGDYEAYPSFDEKAAIYLSRLVANHPLPDGNKRSALQTCIEFCERNGRDFVHVGGHEATNELVWALAAGDVPERDLTAWVAVRIRRR